MAKESDGKSPNTVESAVVSNEGPIYKSFIKWLKKANLAYSQEEIAEHLRVDVKTVGSWLNKKSQPRQKLLKDSLRALRVLNNKKI